MNRLRNFTPSSAHVWAKCPASVTLWQDYLGRYEKTDAQLEGVAAHWVVEQLRRGVEVKEGSLAPNGTPVTFEMIDCAESYLDLLPEDAVLEKTADLSDISHGMVVRVDAHFTRDDGMLVVMDYKFGHAPVSPYRNEQLILAAKALREPEHKGVMLCVYQPRCFIDGDQLKHWSPSDEELDAEVVRVKAAAAEVTSDKPSVNTGHQCLRCPARQACETLRSGTLSIVDLSDTIGSTLDLPPDALGYELKTLQDAAERLKARISGLEQQALSEMEEGTAIPGFGIFADYGRLDWTVPPEKVFALGAMFGVDLKKPDQALTPTQAKKAGLDDAAVEKISARPTRGNKLKRINMEKLERVFKK